MLYKHTTKIAAWKWEITTSSWEIMTLKVDAAAILCYYNNK